MNKPLKIMGLPVDDGGCGWYRIRQPFEMIQKHTPHDTHIVDQKVDNMVEVAKAMELADVLVARPGAEVGIKKILQMPQYFNKKWVLDIDDNTELINPYSNHYREYGIEEVKHKGKWLWKDGEGEFNLKENRERLLSLLWGLKNANLVTVTTMTLAKYAKKYNKNVSILPNYIDFKHWWPLPFKPNKQLRVGWSGGSSHYEDLFSIKEPLNKLMRKYKFKFVFIGQGFPGIIDDDNKHLMESHGWIPFKAHSYRSMAMNLDIAIIPLRDMEFNHYKSSIKLYEMSAMKVPSVVVNILPYSPELNNKRAVGYKTNKEFYDGLEMLIENKEKRLSVGNSAYQWVKRGMSAENNAELWTASYANIIDKKPSN